MLYFWDFLVKLKVDKLDRNNMGKMLHVSETCSFSDRKSDWFSLWKHHLKDRNVIRGQKWCSDDDHVSGTQGQSDNSSIWTLNWVTESTKQNSCSIKITSSSTTNKPDHFSDWPIRGKWKWQNIQRKRKRRNQRLIWSTFPWPGSEAQSPPLIFWSWEVVWWVGRKKALKCVNGHYQDLI